MNRTILMGSVGNYGPIVVGPQRLTALDKDLYVLMDFCYELISN